MRDEILDPRPQRESFARHLAARLAERGDTPRDAQWQRRWHDREGAWASLRNLEHWLEHAAG